MQEVRVFDARGHARAATEFHESDCGLREQGQEQQGAGEGADHRTADYDGYLEGHIPVSASAYPQG